MTQMCGGSALALAESPNILTLHTCSRTLLSCLTPPLSVRHGFVFQWGMAPRARPLPLDHLLQHFRLKPRVSQITVGSLVACSAERFLSRRIR